MCVAIPRKTQAGETAPSISCSVPITVIYLVVRGVCTLDPVNSIPSTNDRLAQRLTVKLILLRVRVSRSIVVVSSHAMLHATKYLVLFYVFEFSVVILEIDVAVSFAFISLRCARHLVRFFAERECTWLAARRLV